MDFRTQLEAYFTVLFVCCFLQNFISGLEHTSKDFFDKTETHV